MPWSEADRPFAREEVLKVPEQPAVFGLRAGPEWVLLGSTANLRKKLLDCLGGKFPWVSETCPSHFNGEIHAEEDCRWRCSELVLELKPRFVLCVSPERLNT